VPFPPIRCVPPNVLSAVNIALQYADRRLLDGVTFHIGPTDRIGLVGANGSGKSTLLKILLGEITPDSGSVTRAKYVTVGYLPQEGTALAGRTLYGEVESVFADIVHTREELEQLQQAMADTPHDTDAFHEMLEIFGELQHRLEAADGFRLSASIEKVLTGLGFTERDFARQTDEFSGGWQMRIALAKLLLLQPSLLLLDEPTNHLDLDSLQWLEEYLQTYQGAVVLVSHDKRFLDTMTRRTFELGLGTLTDYSGNFSFFLEARGERRELQAAAYRNQQQQIKQTERFIERFRYKATKARQVQSRIKQLDKMDIIHLEDEEEQIRFSFPPSPPSGKIAMTLRDVSKSYGPVKVFTHLDLEIDRGDRIAFVGVNGAGKSTLARIIAGVEMYDAGERLPGHNMVLSYFAQHQAEELTPSFDALQTVEAVAAGDVRRHLRTLLGCFLFHGDDVFKKVSVLSGGEKSRLALAKMLLTPANLIVLDEPTNHLDMRSKVVLQEALAEFEGSMVIVSHDRDFLDPLVTKVIEFKEGRIRTWLGNVSEYLAARQAKEEQEEPEGKPAAVSSEKERKRREAELRNQRYTRTKPLQDKLARVEKDIEQLERKKKDLEATMADPEAYRNGQALHEVHATYRTTGERLMDLYHEWGKLSEELDKIRAEYEEDLGRP
jgi:ATP-binding cassette, subfamily F, member 3